MHGPKVWLHHNNALESTQKYFLKQTEKMKARIENINLARKTSQESMLPTLLQLNYKRDQTTYKCWEIEKRCRELEALCESDAITADGLAAANSDLNENKKRGHVEVDVEEQSKRNRTA